MSTWANSITASRLLFFAVCIEELASSRPRSAIILFLFAWGLDAIDGPLARYLGEESVFGSQLDKTVDRIVLFGSVIFLIRFGYIPAIAMFLLVKDLGLVMALTAQKKGKPFPSAGVLGKVISVLQGVGIVWLFAGFPGQYAIVATTALLGGYAAVNYLRRL